MAYISAAIMYASGIWGGIYLITTGHPWFGFLVLIITGCIEVKTHN